MPFSFAPTWKRLICLIAFGFSFAFPLSASAEPIHWSFRSTIITDGASSIYIGPVTVGVESPDGEFTYPGHAYGGIPIGGGEDNIEGSRVGGNRIRLATLGNQNFSITTTPRESAAPNFRLRLEVTDLTSEEQGSLEFTGWVSLGYGVIWINRYNLLDIGLGGVGSLELGGNRYSLDVRSYYTESNAIVEANVTVSPLVPTPEPSTLILAGLGFSAFAFRKRRPPELV